jgi:hypothetical protein
LIDSRYLVLHAGDSGGRAVEAEKMQKRLGPLSAVDHAALVRLCEHKKLVHRADGYGTGSETLISTASAITLKKRKFAVAGWSGEMYPTNSGHAIVAAKPVAASG